jgi:hypothetical protein
MRQRVVASLGVMTVITVVTLAIGVAGQAPTPAQQGPAAKTSWGEPELQGIWTIDYQIPLQRPAKYKDKAFFTDAEIAQLDKVRAAKPSLEKRGERGTDQDVAGAYNSDYFTIRRHTGQRTSLIVDPPDGRLPPLTPAAQQRIKEIREFELAHLEATQTCKNHWRAARAGSTPAYRHRGCRSRISTTRRASRPVA